MQGVGLPGCEAVTYEFEVRQLVEQPVASIIIGRIPREAVGAVLGGALPDVFSHLTANGVAMVAAPFARYHGRDDGTFDLEAGIPVTGAFPETATIKLRTLPGGEAVATTHVGSYDRLPEAAAALAHWRLAHGRVAAGPFWEVYVDDPTDLPTTEVRTEVIEPLTARVS